MARTGFVSIAEDLRVRMVPIASRVARLCSAAQVLSGLGRHLGQVRNDLLPPFEVARDSVRRFHAALGRGDDVDAHGLLSNLAVDVEQLNVLLGDLDEVCSSAELARWIEDEPTVAADALARLVEFYATDRKRSAGTDEKLILVTRSLMLRDEVNAADADGILAALQRRYLLQQESLPTALPAADLIARFRSLRGRIDAAATTDGDAASESEAGSEETIDIGALEAEYLQLCEQLGESLTTPAGLSLAVAGRGWIERCRDTLSRREARPFANLLNDLEGVFDATGEGTLPAPLEEDCPEALALLRRAEDELRASVANGTAREDGFLLDEEEVTAITAVAEGRGSDLQCAVLSVASARTAVDRLARAHARGSLPEGAEPDPLPRAQALTYLREASRLENVLSDHVQQAVLRGEYLLAKSASRSGHKLARSRLGLALLGDLPVTGHAQRESIGSDAQTQAGSAERDQEESRMKSELEVARIMRDALLGDARPNEQAGAAVADAGAGAARPTALRNSARGKGKAELTPEQAERRRMTVLLVCLGVTALLTLGYHGRNWLQKAPQSPDLNPMQFAHSAPIDRAIPVNDQLVVVATISWDRSSEADREKYVKGLWTDARQLGYHRMVVLNNDRDRPLAIASEGSVRILPIAGDLKYFAEQQKAGGSR